MCRNKVQGIVHPPIDIAELGVANPDRILQHGCKYRLKIAGGAANNLQHLRRGRLLLQRLGEIVGALAQFVEQARIFDSNDGLGSEILNQRNLLVGKGSNLMAVQAEHTDQFVLL